MTRPVEAIIHAESPLTLASVMPSSIFLAASAACDAASWAQEGAAHASAQHAANASKGEDCQRFTDQALRIRGDDGTPGPRLQNTGDGTIADQQWAGTAQSYCACGPPESNLRAVAGGAGGRTSKLLTLMKLGPAVGRAAAAATGGICTEPK